MDQKIKPMGFWQALLFFAVPGIFMYIGFYYIVPPLYARGIPFVVTTVFFTYGTLGFLIPASLILFKKEGNSITWKGICERFRIKPLKGKQLLVVIGLFVLVTAFEFVTEELGLSLKDIPGFAPPSVLPDLYNPNVELALPLKTFFGVKLSGQFWIIPFFLLCLVFNIIGEEFMWRGYMLPRMEKRFGKRAWLVNGLLWCFVLHAATKWMYPTLLATCLTTPYITQKYKNTTAAILIHGLGNLLFQIFMIPSIFR